MMFNSYLEKIIFASLEATRGNKRKAKELVFNRALKDETLLAALAKSQLMELVDLNFSEYVQSKAKPANLPKLNEKDLDNVIAHLDAKSDVKQNQKYPHPHWRIASSNLVVMRSEQKSLSKKELDHILDHYF